MRPNNFNKGNCRWKSFCWLGSDNILPMKRFRAKAGWELERGKLEQAFWCCWRTQVSSLLLYRIQASVVDWQQDFNDFILLRCAVALSSVTVNVEWTPSWYPGHAILLNREPRSLTFGALQMEYTGYLLKHLGKCFGNLQRPHQVRPSSISKEPYSIWAAPFSHNMKNVIKCKWPTLMIDLILSNTVVVVGDSLAGTCFLDTVQPMPARQHKQTMYLAKIKCNQRQ